MGTCEYPQVPMSHSKLVTYMYLTCKYKLLMGRNLYDSKFGFINFNTCKYESELTCRLTRE